MADKNKLLAEIGEVSFSLYDIALFLDTHPDEPQALERFAQLNERRQQALEEFEASHYPLTMDCMKDTSEWTWGSAPAPWEVDANVEL